MEYLNNEDLREKDPSNTRGSGVSAFIKETLELIPEGQGLAMSDLAKAIADQFELPVQQSYVRIGNVLKRKSHSNFVRLQDEKGKTFISRKAVEVNLDSEGA